MRPLVLAAFLAACSGALARPTRKNTRCRRGEVWTPESASGKLVVYRYR